MPKPIFPPVVGIVTALGCAFAPASAQTIIDPARNPVRTDEVLGFSAAQGVRYDSNVFRLADDTPTAATADAGQRHDFISTTVVRAGMDKQFGRHRLFLMGEVSPVRYRRFDELDYVGQDVLADWSGRIGTYGRYGLNYEHLRVATNPAEQLTPSGNTATTDRVGADIGLPVGPRWQVVTAWRADRTQNSAQTEQGGNNKGWAADGGVRFLPATGNNVDLRYRHSRYNYPNVIPTLLTDNTYSQEELELSSNWQIDEPSRFEGRTSYVRRRHDNVPGRDFSGWIGSLKYVWRPTVDTSASVRVFKDLGAVSDSSASYAKTWGISFLPAWNLSPKVALGSVLEWHRRVYDGFSLISRSPENTTRVGLNARYSATRNWQFAFSVADEHRTSSDSTHEYSDVISSLSVQWKL